MFDYIVQPGDTLYSIADYFDVSVYAILNANPGLNPNYLYIGQRLRIPISRFLYQSYPWYYLFPYLFIRFPRSHWNDRRRWPSGRRDGDGRRDRDGWWNRDDWRSIDFGRNMDGRRDLDFGRNMDGRRSRQTMGEASLASPENDPWFEASDFPEQGS